MDMDVLRGGVAPKPHASVRTVSFRPGAKTVIPRSGQAQARREDRKPRPGPGPGPDICDQMRSFYPARDQQPAARCSSRGRETRGPPKGRHTRGRWHPAVATWAFSVTRDQHFHPRVLPASAADPTPRPGAAETAEATTAANETVARVPWKKYLSVRTPKRPLKVAGLWLTSSTR